MNTNIEVLRELDELVEAARLLGVTQAKKLFGCHTDEDRRFERAMYESIDKHRAALLDWEAKQPAPQQPAAVEGLAARLVDELDGLVSESDGVSGLHLNGDVASWDELLPGGRFERLSSLDELREALTAQHQEPTT